MFTKRLRLWSSGRTTHSEWLPTFLWAEGREALNNLQHCVAPCIGAATLRDWLTAILQAEEEDDEEDEEEGEEEEGEQLEDEEDHEEHHECRQHALTASGKKYGSWSLHRSLPQALYNLAG